MYPLSNAVWGLLGGRGLEDLEDEPPSPRSRSAEEKSGSCNSLAGQKKSGGYNEPSLTVLPSGRGNISNTGCQLALPPLIGGVPGAVAGASALLTVMLSRSAALPRRPGGAAAGPGPVQAHGTSELRAVTVHH